MNRLIEIDGSVGEGGGQVLRTALALSVATGTAIRISHIRAGRPNPGLAHQHLTCIRAATHVASARVRGAELGAQTLEFEPGQPCPGEYSFDVTTAGSVSLVLHTLFLPLSLAKGDSRITLRGGTHVKWSPSFEFLHNQWLFYLRKIGFSLSACLEKAGYYPKGGGLLKARIQTAGQLRPLVLSDRGQLREVRGQVFVSNLKRAIAERQLARVRDILKSRNLSPEIETCEYASPGTGTGTHLHAEFENGSGSYTSLGEKGVPAERVAADAADNLWHYIESGAAVDPFMADQLILPLAFAEGESFFTSERVTQHLVTNARIVEMFLPIKVDVRGQLGQPGEVRVIPQS